MTMPDEARTLVGRLRVNETFESIGAALDDANISDLSKAHILRNLLVGIVIYLPEPERSEFVEMVCDELRVNTASR